MKKPTTTRECIECVGTIVADLIMYSALEANPCTDPTCNCAEKLPSALREMADSLRLAAAAVEALAERHGKTPHQAAHEAATMPSAN